MKKSNKTSIENKSETSISLDNNAPNSCKDIQLSDIASTGDKFTSSSPLSTQVIELEKLAKALDSLIASGKYSIAQKYLDGYLESKNVNSLDDYLHKLD